MDLFLQRSFKNIITLTFVHLILTKVLHLPKNSIILWSQKGASIRKKLWTPLDEKKLVHFVEDGISIIPLFPHLNRSQITDLKMRKLRNHISNNWFVGRQVPSTHSYSRWPHLSFIELTSTRSTTGTSSTFAVHSATLINILQINLNRRSPEFFYFL